MSGRFFLDTNTIIELLQGNTSLFKNIENATWLGISIISVLEFLSFPKLSKADKQLFMEFLSRVTVIELNLNNIQLISKISEIRSNKKLKLPDAIIVASAITSQAKLLSADKRLIRDIV